jgi:single-stranded-DNA-specific exonuclease
MRWSIRSAEQAQVESLSVELQSVAFAQKFNPAVAGTLARLLVMRGINTGEAAHHFLSPSLSDLHSPYLLTGMKSALDRIEAAIERKETVLIYGDYDVDGTTAIVILKTAIELCGGTTDFHVPHRIREGYDMRDDVIERAAATGIRLIISVDMGIRAFAPAETARRLGVDLIVTDHHLPGPSGIPQALAVVNPNQAGCEYPCKSICGAGVAFKLAQGLIARRLTDTNTNTNKDQSRLLTSFMKIVAIATVADSVPLAGENRIFTKIGLDALRKAVNPGLKALLAVAKLGGQPLTSGEVAFRIAPRINAAGRMDVARDVIELFSVKDPVRAVEIANRLDQLNSERQEEERRILESINKRFEEDPGLSDAFCVVVDGEGWHRGVIGITATRVVERYGRPALVISKNGDEAHGSGRSIKPFHLLNALESCPELFTRFGGHSHAVGFSLPSANVEELRARLDAHARSCLSLDDFDPILEADAELSLAQITPELFAALEQMEPFGAGNHAPVFVARGVRLMAPPKVIKEKHVRLKIAPPLQQEGNKNSQAWRNSVAYNALGWRMAEKFQQEALIPGDTFDIAFTLDHNDHPEFGGLELTLRDFKTAKAAETSAGV